VALDEGDRASRVPSRMNEWAVRMIQRFLVWFFQQPTGHLVNPPKVGPEEPY